jgi:hypothetical protein
MRVYFTVDTESSMAGAWWHPDRRPVEAARHVFCRIGNEDFGIPLLTRIMGELGLRATYFVETLATSSLGESDTRSIFEFLLKAGQDVQLHVHPVFRLYADMLKARTECPGGEMPKPRDFIGAFSKEAQMELLGEAIDYFLTFAGRKPTAFRAGCYAGSRSLMRCLFELGIRLDSSFNPCYHKEISFPGEALEPNVVQKIEGVWEMPVTVARTRLPEGHGGFRFADCSSLSFPELRTMLDVASAAGQEHFVIVFHSFSAVKTKDLAYSQIRPNRIVIRRLEKLLRYLVENSRRFSVGTLGSAAEDPDILSGGPSEAVVASLGFASAIGRKVVQWVNGAYWV